MRTLHRHRYNKVWSDEYGIPTIGASTTVGVTWLSLKVKVWILLAVVVFGTIGTLAYAAGTGVFSSDALTSAPTSLPTTSAPTSSPTTSAPTNNPTKNPTSYGISVAGGVNNTDTPIVTKDDGNTVFVAATAGGLALLGLTGCCWFCAGGQRRKKRAQDRRVRSRFPEEEEPLTNTGVRPLDSLFYLRK